jgi:hypothetical protein
MNEKVIQELLMRDCLFTRHHKALIPNSTQLLWSEADLLSVTKAGFVHEFEIKCSRADYNRELGNNNKYNKKSKHRRLQNPGKYSNKERIPNYFWFVTYGFEIEPPDHAGWILVEELEHTKSLYYCERKKAPRLHNDKWDDGKIAKIARLLSFRLLNYYSKEKKEL